MRGVGEELSFAVVGLPDAFEQCIEGVSQASDLVVLAGGDGEQRRPVGVLRGEAVSLDRVEGCPGGSVADERGGDQGGEVGDGELEQQLTQCLVVLVLADGRCDHDVAARGVDCCHDDLVGVVSWGEEVADVLANIGSGRCPREGVLVSEPSLGVAGDDLSSRVVDLVALAGCVGRWRVAGGDGALDDLLVGVEVLVELPVQGVSDAPEHERSGDEEHGGHGGRDGQHQAGDDGSVTDEAAPQRHTGIISASSLGVLESVSDAS